MASCLDETFGTTDPFFEIRKNGSVVPKVSPNAYRVFRVQFPDPNKFAFPDKDVYNPDTERLVWAVRGVEISRGQPLGIPVSGHPLFNRSEDVENSGKYATIYKDGNDHRQNIAMDPKQTQLFIIGCTPATAEYWTKADMTCATQKYEAGDAPPIELKNTLIQDGDMGDIGFGNLDFRVLQESRSEVPLDIVDSISLYPDYIKMAKEKFGNSMFFYARREQIYGRHFFARDGMYDKEVVPESLYLKTSSNGNQKTLSSHNYTVTPSGSLVSTDSQLMNRPYWIQKAQGKNNGIAWNNELFVTVLDNTRGTVFQINVANVQNVTTWTPSNFQEYSRHVEEYELEFIMQLCKVKLTPENVALLHAMDPRIIEDWQISLSAPQSNALEDTYRYIESLATKCPPKTPPEEDKDPWAKYKFWNVDLTERMSEELDMYSLGRKFIYQSGLSNRVTNSISTRPRRAITRGVKRKRRSQQ